MNLTIVGQADKLYFCIVLSCFIFYRLQVILLVIHVLEERCASKIHNTADTLHEALPVHIDISPKCGTKKVVFYVYFRMAVPISLSLHTVNKSSKTF